MKKIFNSNYKFISIIIIIISIIFILSVHAYRLTRGSYKLPYVFDINKELKPIGNAAWLPSYSITATKESIKSFAYFPNGHSIVIGESGGRTGGRVKKIDLKSKRILWSVRPLSPLTYKRYLAIEHVTVSPNGRYVAVVPDQMTGGARNHPYSITILDGYSGRKVRTIRIPSFLPPCRGSRYDVRNMLVPIDVKFTPNSNNLIAFHKNSVGVNYGGCVVVRDRWIIKWSIPNGRMVWKYQLKMPAIPRLGVPEESCLLPWQKFDISPDGKKIAVGNCAGQVEIINTRTGRKIMKIPSYIFTRKRNRFPGFSSVCYVKFSPIDNNKIYFSMGSSGAKTLIVNLNLNRRDFSNILTTGVRMPSPTLSLSKDGRIFVAGGDQICIWDTKLRKLLYTGCGSWAYKFQMNPKYREIATISGTDVVFIHLRKRRNNITVGKNWTNTGLFVTRHTGFYLKANGGKFHKDVNVSRYDSRARAYSYKEFYHNGLYHNHKSGYLYLKSRYGETLNVSIIGGLTSREKNIRIFRNNLPRWGSYPDNSAYGSDNERTPKPTILNYLNKRVRHKTIQNRLIQLAKYLRSHYLNRKHKYFRNYWYRKVKEARTARQLARLLMSFEKKTRWSAFDKRWKYKRRHFLRDGRRARNYIHVAHMMMNMEMLMYSSAFDKYFKRIREEWISDLKMVVKAGERQKTANREKERETRKYNISPEKANEEFKHAVNTNKVKLLRAAIKAGANIELKMTLGNTGLYMACAAGDTEIARELINSRANVNFINFIGNTPLMIASYRNRIPIVKLLIISGAKVNIQNKAGKTALMYAALKGYTQVIRILIHAGANVNLRDKQGRSAIDFTPGYHRRHLRTILRRAGAK